MADIDDRWHWRDKDGTAHRTARYGQGARWLLRWRDPDGRQRKKSFKRKADAEKYATDLEHRLGTGTYIAPDAGKVTVSEWSSRWLDAQVHMKPTSKDRAAGILRTHVLPKWGAVRLADVAHADVQSWIGVLSTDLAPASVAKVHRVF